MLKFKILTVLVIFSFIFLSSCSLINKSYTSEETGTSLGKEYSNSYKFLKFSKLFLDRALYLSNIAYQEDYISEKEKEKIVDYANTYKEIQKEATDIMVTWKNNIDEGASSGLKNAIYEKITKLLNKANGLESLINNYTDEKIVIPDSFLENMEESLKRAKNLE